VLSWVVQHPELESFVAHDAYSYVRLFAMITMSHRRSSGWAAGSRRSICSWWPGAAAQGHRARPALQAMRRAEALGCRRIEMLLPETRSERHTFFENQGFENNGNDLWIRRF